MQRPCKTTPVETPVGVLAVWSLLERETMHCHHPAPATLTMHETDTDHVSRHHLGGG